jgi:HEAT repeat protein
VRAALADRTTASARALLSKTLRGKNGYLVGLVCDALDEADADLLALLPDAFAVLQADAVKRDPGCRGQTAIAKALDRAEARSDAVFLVGVRHVQLEPVWGGRADTAAELRGVCGMALVHGRHERAMIEVAELLADPEVRARVAAARALAASGDRTVAEPLLRLRIAAGEADAEVVGECFTALLELARTEAIDFVARFLAHRNGEVAEAAALALGGSRLKPAFAVLREANESLVGSASRRVRMLAIALLRDDEAWSWLLGVIERESPAAATDAIHALASFRHDTELCTRLRAAIDRRGDASLARIADEAMED